MRYRDYLIMMVMASAACADPCLDDGLLQKDAANCPAAATDGASGAEGTQDASETDSNSASNSNSNSNSNSASAGDSTGADDSGTVDASATLDGDGSGETGDTDGGPDDTEEFEPGAFIIPMDEESQAEGILRAYGLVYQLMDNGIVVRWVIRNGKAYDEEDFIADAVNIADGTVYSDQLYRGGPFVVSADDAVAALAVITQWQTDNPQTAVHEVTAAFTADIARRYDRAPSIAIFADGNEDIARQYLQAAGIPDSTGDFDWPDTSPDVLTVQDIAGPSEADHRDGALFANAETPAFCQLMSMHWGVGDAEDNPEVVAEVREFLNFDTHFFAECQAVSAFENLEPYGFFLSPNGLEISDKVNDHDFSRADSPFAQMVGAFGSVGGSEPSFTLPAGDAYLQPNTVIITEAGTPEGVADVWLTGFLDGACGPDEAKCDGAGKISYLGGHSYDVDVPIADNAATQGTRLFLNALFEAPCAFVN